ncbi:MAG: hypothetical protein KDD25_02450 [Bdellovibrionales bacterium]|nr:hypothetical protein [Bdellovibrionales bacterium]
MKMTMLLVVTLLANPVFAWTLKSSKVSLHKEYLAVVDNEGRRCGEYCSTGVGRTKVCYQACRGGKVTYLNSTNDLILKFLIESIGKRLDMSGRYLEYWGLSDDGRTQYYYEVDEASERQ